MLSNSRVIILAILVCLACTREIQAGGLARADIAKLGKPATVLVETKTKKSGSAFCFHPAGLFLTNEHVVRGSEAEVHLIFHAGLREQKIVKAKLLRVDRDLDLALLQVEGQKDLPYLTLGSDEKVSELAEVIAFGFPFGSALAPGKDEYPSVSVNVGSVTALRMKNRVLHRIQVDAVLNPGNSGGPVLDKDGKVVGVVQGGVVGAGVNFAIPVSHVMQFVSRPELLFYPPRVKPYTIHDPVEFEVRARSLIPSKNEMEIELILNAADLPERKIKMSGKDGIYRATTEVVPRPAGPQLLKLAAVFPNGSVTGDVADRTVKVGKQELKLTEIRRIITQPEPRVVLREGKIVKGALEGLDALPIQLGNLTVRLDLTKATETRLESPGTIGTMNCTVVATLDGKELGRTVRFIHLGGAPSVIDEFVETDLEPPALAKDEVMVALPSLVSDLTVGGAGRFIVLHLPRVSKLAIFDVNQAKIVHTIPLPANTVKFAASMDKLVVAFPGSRTLERWNLRNFKKEVSSPYPFNGELEDLAIGSGSSGPIVSLVKTEIRAGSFETKYQLLDLEKLQPVAFDWERGPQTPQGIIKHMRASIDGKTITLWCTSHSPSGMTLVHWKDKTASGAYEHTANGHVIPGAGGKWAFTGLGLFQIENNQFKSAFNSPARFDRYIPANQGGYYLNLGQAPGNNRPAKSPAVYRLGIESPILEVPQLDIPHPKEEWLKDDFTFDKRIHFLPNANLVIVIPLSNDRLTLYRVNVADGLKPGKERK